MEKSSQTKKIVTAVIVLVVIFIGALYFMSNKPSGDSALLGTTQTGEKSRSSLKDLLTKASPTKCTVSSINDNSETSGVVYIANGNMRGDFTTTMKGTPAEGKVVVAHMIIDKDASYMWSDDPTMKMGIKMAKKDMLDTQASAGTPSKQASIDVNQQSDYDCSSWSADNSVFVPPTTIEFQDMAQMMKSIPQAPSGDAGASIPKGGVGAQTGMTPAQMAEVCGACDQAGAGRDQCRAALGCK